MNHSVSLESRVSNTGLVPTVGSAWGWGEWRGSGWGVERARGREKAQTQPAGNLSSQRAGCLSFGAFCRHPPPRLGHHLLGCVDTWRLGFSLVAHMLYGPGLKVSVWEGEGTLGTELNILKHSLNWSVDTEVKPLGFKSHFFFF